VIIQTNSGRQSVGGGIIGIGETTNTTNNGPANSDQFASLMEKRKAEVEIRFLHLQQNIEIPEINIIIHPVIL
jgi:hypothetical protein